MDGRDPLPRATRPGVQLWIAIALAAAIVLAGIVAFRVTPTRSEEWVLTSMATDGYVASLTPDVPFAAFGSGAFQGPFVVEVTAPGGPIDLRLTVNGEPVLRARAHDIAYVYPFETRAGNPLSIDLLLSLPPSSSGLQVFIGFFVPKGTSPATYRTAGVSPATAPAGLFAGPVRSAFTPTGHSDPAVSLGIESHSFPPNSTYCWGFTNFKPRGYGWVNVTVPEGVRYYYEIWSEGAQPRSVVMGDVEGSTMNHFHWTAKTFGLQAGTCKPTVSATVEVAVEGPI